jgi:hypothetical protein
MREKKKGQNETQKERKKRSEIKKKRNIHTDCVMGHVPLKVRSVYHRPKFMSYNISLPEGRTGIAWEPSETLTIVISHYHRVRRNITCKDKRCVPIWNSSAHRPIGNEICVQI